MEVIDREREKESLEQIDATLIFVCLAFFVFRLEVLIYQTQMMRNSGLEPYVPAIPTSKSMVVSRLLFTPLGPEQPGCASGSALTQPMSPLCRNTVLRQFTVCGFMNPVDHKDHMLV